MTRCPSCKQLFDPLVDKACLPFCSDRCRLIDLGAWLNEEHRIPAEDPPAQTTESTLSH